MLSRILFRVVGNVIAEELRGNINGSEEPYLCLCGKHYSCQSDCDNYQGENNPDD